MICILTKVKYKNYYWLILLWFCCKCFYIIFHCARFPKKQNYIITTDFALDCDLQIKVFQKYFHFDIKIYKTKFFRQPIP